MTENRIRAITYTFKIEATGLLLHSRGSTEPSFKTACSGQVWGQYFETELRDFFSTLSRLWYNSGQRRVTFAFNFTYRNKQTFFRNIQGLQVLKNDDIKSIGVTYTGWKTVHVKVESKLTKETFMQLYLVQRVMDFNIVHSWQFFKKNRIYQCLK